MFDHIRDFLDKNNKWDSFSREYEKYLDILLEEEENAEWRVLVFRILEAKTASRYAKTRLEAYKQGYRLFGESFVKQALSDSASSVANWAREILDPSQGWLF
jgi:predicted secreted protein